MTTPCSTIVVIISSDDEVDKLDEGNGVAEAVAEEGVVDGDVAEFKQTAHLILM